MAKTYRVNGKIINNLPTIEEYNETEEKWVPSFLFQSNAQTSIKTVASIVKHGIEIILEKIGEQLTPGAFSYSSADVGKVDPLTIPYESFTDVNGVNLYPLTVVVAGQITLKEGTYYESNPNLFGGTDYKLRSDKIIENGVPQTLVFWSTDGYDVTKEVVVTSTGTEIIFDFEPGSAVTKILVKMTVDK